ncbi:uncharacterized protein LOC131943692 [Physella acuta]|uniref:uncharacterized protein LOC131943692 n=1 Tax=Physella acuta TaxID=109671 RepID=UPI0027DB8C4C|nr:uncharacterized protein LOC131943692 [Physella acuta]
MICQKIVPLFSFVWIIYIFLCCNIGFLAAAPSNSNSICFTNGNNYVFYNNRVQMCCKNKVHNRVTGTECCALANGTSEFYNKRDSVCCGKQIKDRYFKSQCPEGKSHCTRNEATLVKCSPNDVNCEEHDCCGKQLYNVEHEICCSDDILELTDQQKLDRDYFSCCGKHKLIDIRQEFCCGEEPRKRNLETDCCGTTVFTPKTENCLTRIDSEYHLHHYITSKHELLCGKEIYNIRKQGCCSGVLHSVPEMSSYNVLEANPNFGCCDSQYMNPNTHICCRNHHHPNFATHPIPKSSDFKCCGDSYYNITSEDCINGKAEKIQPDTYLCGGVHVDIRLGCCGFQAYNKSTEQCCQGLFTSNKMNFNETCCNGYPINDTQLCCDGFMPATKSNSEDNECCFNEWDIPATFNKVNGQRCINGKIHEGYGPRNEPCGPNGQYDPTRGESCCDNQICKSKSKKSEAEEDVVCDGKSFKYEPGFICCGNSYIDYELEICCHEKVYKLKDKYKCCGEQYIDSRKKQCCGGKICPLKEDKSEEEDDDFVNCEEKEYKYKQGFICCGNSYIDYELEICCRENVYKLKDKYECCGEHYIHSRKNQCSDGEIRPLKEDKSEEEDDDFVNCEGKKYKYKPGFICCGNSYINYESQICCHEHVYKVKDNHECCGIFYIDSRSKQCCGQKIPFSNSSQCRNNKVIPNASNKPKINLMCNSRSLKNIDRLLMYACTKKYAIQATVEMPKRKNRTLKIKVKNIVDLKQDKSASIWHSYKDISVQINNYKGKSLQCDRKSLGQVFIFFDEAKDAAGVKVIKKNSNFFMFAYSKRQKSLLMESLKGEYCLHFSPS